MFEKPSKAAEFGEDAQIGFRRYPFAETSLANK
jgi:hypothetical protein